MAETLSTEWLRCGACLCYLNCPSNYRRHFLLKHGGAGAKTVPPQLLLVPKPLSAITIFPATVKISKLSAATLGSVKIKMISLKIIRRKIPSNKVYSNDSPKQCGICNKILSNVYLLRRHISALHTMERPYKCGHCNKRFPRLDQLQSHQRLHSNKTEFGYDCQHCQEKFRYLSTLNHHLLMKHTPDEQKRKFECHLCDLYFYTPDKLAGHQQRAHKINNVKVKRRQCLICGKSVTGLKDHLRLHNSEKGFKCDICNKAFTQASNLRTHRRTHQYSKQSPRPFACDHCDKSYLTKDHLRTHFKTVHIGIKKISCPICEKKFSMNSQLHNHLTSHVEERSHKCDHCGKSFKTKTNLNIHLKIHLEDKQFECDACGLSFVQKGNYMKHVQTKRHARAVAKVKL